MKQLRQIAKSKAATYGEQEGGNHTKVTFDGHNLTTVPRHAEVNELTARNIIRTAENWEG